MITKSHGGEKETRTAAKQMRYEWKYKEQNKPLKREHSLTNLSQLKIKYRNQYFVLFFSRARSSSHRIALFCVWHFYDLEPLVMGLQ